MSVPEPAHDPVHPAGPAGRVPPPGKRGAWKKWAITALRWGVAVAGVWYVVAHLSIRDQVLVAQPDGTVKLMSLDQPTDEASASFPVRTMTGVVDVPRAGVVNEPDVTRVGVAGVDHPLTLRGVDVVGDVNHAPRAARFLVADGGKSTPGRWVRPDEVVGYAMPKVYPHARVQVGLKQMVRNARPAYLWAALLVFPLTFVLTSYRWHELLKVLEIDLPFARAFELNMVGSFWNTCIPGSTGGDLLKALYVSKQTPHRTRAVMSVLIDRAVGLLALILLGGAVAATQWPIRACRDVALASAALCACTALGMLVFFNPTLHRFSGLGAILARLPRQKQVRGAVDSMLRYGRQPWLSLWTLVVSFPVHATVVTSAMLAGMAFKLPLHGTYYWVCVPVIVLAAAVPISFQGAGIMEYLAILLTHSQGVTVSQAVALAMSVRVVQILWNLAGGIFVLRGGFHVPTATERADLEAAGSAALPGGPAEPPVAV